MYKSIKIGFREISFGGFPKMQLYCPFAAKRHNGIPPDSRLLQDITV